MGAKIERAPSLSQRRLTVTKPRSNHPRLATWKPRPIQETIHPLPKLASAKSWGGGGTDGVENNMCTGPERKPKPPPYEGSWGIDLIKEARPTVRSYLCQSTRAQAQN